MTTCTYFNPGCFNPLCVTCSSSCTPMASCLSLFLCLLLLTSICSQTGFGWTNGVVLHFLRLYGSVLRVSVEAPVEETRPFWVIGLVLAIVALSLCFLLGGMWCRWIYITGRTGYWRRVQNEHAVATRGYHESDDFDVEDDSVMLGNVTALSGSTQGILSTVHETEPSL